MAVFNVLRANPAGPDKSQDRPGHFEKYGLGVRMATVLGQNAVSNLGGFDLKNCDSAR